MYLKIYNQKYDPNIHRIPFSNFHSIKKVETKMLIKTKNL